MRTTAILVCVLVTGSWLLGQISVEEAYKRLEEKQKARATQSTTTPTSVVTTRPHHRSGEWALQWLRAAGFRVSQGEDPEQYDLYTPSKNTHVYLHIWRGWVWHIQVNVKNVESKVDIQAWDQVWLYLVSFADGGPTALHLISQSLKRAMNDPGQYIELEGNDIYINFIYNPTDQNQFQVRVHLPPEGRSVIADQLDAEVRESSTKDSSGHSATTHATSRPVTKTESLRIKPVKRINFSELATVLKDEGYVLRPDVHFPTVHYARSDSRRVNLTVLQQEKTDRIAEIFIQGRDVGAFSDGDKKFFSLGCLLLAQFVGSADHTRQRIAAMILKAERDGRVSGFSYTTHETNGCIVGVNFSQQTLEHGVFISARPLSGD